MKDNCYYPSMKRESTTTTTKKREWKDGYPTSVFLRFEEITALDRIAAQARELDPRHPHRARMTLVAHAVRRFLEDEAAIADALSGVADGA